MVGFVEQQPHGCLLMFCLLFCLFQRCYDYKGLITSQRNEHVSAEGGQVSAVAEAQGGIQMDLKLGGREKSTSRYF